MWTIIRPIYKNVDLSQKGTAKVLSTIFVHLPRGEERKRGNNERNRRDNTKSLDVF
jgi:hypothetical protein